MADKVYLTPTPGCLGRGVGGVVLLQLRNRCHKRSGEQRENDAGPVQVETDCLSSSGQPLARIQTNYSLCKTASSDCLIVL